MTPQRYTQLTRKDAGEILDALSSTKMTASSDAVSLKLAILPIVWRIQSRRVEVEK